MAYENMTYEFILDRMMNRVLSEYPNLDNREGSIIFNALAPAALELAIMYTEIDNAIKESFVATASREYILKSCAEMGMDISRFNASAGTHKAEFNVEVPIGSRWNCDLYNYEIIEYLGQENGYHTYSALCDTIGSSPNNQTGSLTAITDIPTGLTYAELTECLIEGENESSDDQIRQAYFDFVNDIATDGNVGQYKVWCSEYDGIGGHKIIPLWNGANTVKVSILTASNRAIDTSESGNLVEKFQEYLDPGIKGMGDGVAPIGAFVTVSTATEVKINVSATVKMKSGYSDTTPLNTALENYFAKIAYQKANVPYMSLGAALLDATGVEFVTNLKVNGGTADIMLGEEEIPIVGTVNWTVV